MTKLLNGYKAVVHGALTIIPVGRRFELTPLGESLVTKVNDLLLLIDSTLGTKPEFLPETSKRHFLIAASDYSINVLFLDVLKEMRQTAPHVTVAFRQPTGKTYQELESGEVDFVIAPEWHATPGFSSCRLFDDTYCGVVDINNSSTGDSLSLDQYFAGRHVAMENVGGPMFDTWCEHTYPKRRSVDVQAPSFSVLPHLVVGTDRIATMHTRLADKACTYLPVRKVHLDIDYPPFVEMLLWHNYRDHDPGMVWVREMLLQYAQAMPHVMP